MFECEALLQMRVVPPWRHGPSFVAGLFCLLLGSVKRNGYLSCICDYGMILEQLFEIWSNFHWFWSNFLNLGATITIWEQLTNFLPKL